MDPTIYLDYQATTPLDERVLAAMLPYLTKHFGNPASAQHVKGREAAEAVAEARERLAALLGADRREIFFTSGATEANNLALKGLAANASRRRLVTVATEHPAVLDPLRALARRGYDIHIVDVNDEGQPDLDMLADAVNDETLVVSLAAANNEIGTLPPLRAVADIAHAEGALFHTDAAQAVGKIDLDVERDCIDLLSLSAHKLYGPKGCGALYIRREHQRRLEPLQHGGGHERGLRSGTLNTAGVIGLAAAVEIAGPAWEQEADRLRALAERFLARLHDEADGLHLNGPRNRLPGNLNVRIDGVDTEALIANCPELCFSAGSACSAATLTPSHVLLAIGLSEQEADQSARFGFGRPTTEAHVDRAAEILSDAIARIRHRSGAKVEIG